MSLLLLIRTVSYFLLLIIGFLVSVPVSVTFVSINTFLKRNLKEDIYNL